MEDKNFLDEAVCHIAELHDIARKLEKNNLTKSMAYKIRTFADELHLEVTTLKNKNSYES